MKNNKFIIFFCAVAVIFFAVNAAYASGSHYGGQDGIDGQDGLRGKQGLPGKDGGGTASAIAASQHHFYWGTNSWQGSVGIGAYNSDTAFSFGLAKRFNKTLINGNISQEEGKFGGGFGVNFLF